MLVFLFLLRGFRLSAAPTAMFWSPLRGSVCGIFVFRGYPFHSVVSPIGCTHGYVLVTAPRLCLWDFRVPWVSVPFRGFSYRLHPRLCSGHRSAVMVFVYFAVVGCICCGRKIPIFGHIIVMIFRGLWMGCVGIATGCVVWRNERRRRDQITTVGSNPRNTAYVRPMHVTAER